MWANVGAVTAALPCATQNEIGHGEAETLVSAGVVAVAEGTRGS
jgi:glutamate dehydrogenase/leucine dehydrogenase